MKADVAKCSNCGAALPPQRGTDGVRCVYCGNVSRIDEPPAPVAPLRPRLEVPARRRPAIGGARLALRAVILLVVLGVAAARLAALPKGTSLTQGLPLPVVSVTGMQWEGVHGPILADVNGDRVPDLLGRVRYVLGGDRVMLAAFDGANGSKLWESEALGSYSETYQGVLGLADDTLLFASPGGELRAYGSRDGKKRWTSSLSEKATGYCKGDRGGEVRVKLADKGSAHLRTADGQAMVAPPAPAHAPTGPASARGKDKETDGCVRLPSDDGKASDPGYELRSAGFGDVAVDGMSVRTLIQRPGGPKVVLGTRAKGTSVPMIAAVFEDASRNWKSDLAGTRPLETGPFAPDLAALTANRAFTEYGFADSSKAHELVCFDLGGHRQWEVALPSRDPISSIEATDQRVFVSQWGRLSAHDASTGAASFSIGKR
jgi:outer membrane protein assembly factor BamB